MTTYTNTDERWGGAESGLTVDDYQKQAEAFGGGIEITADNDHVYADGVAIADAE